MNTDLFKKIIVKFNNTEIDVKDQLDNTGKYTLPEEANNVKVKFFFKNEKRISDKLFVNNKQITNIDLTDDVSVDDGAFAKLNISNEVKTKLLSLESVKEQSFKYNFTIGDCYWRVQDPEKTFEDPWTITNINDNLPEFVWLIGEMPNHTYSSSNTDIATINQDGQIQLTQVNGKTTLSISFKETEETNAITFSKKLIVNIQPENPETPLYFYIGITFPTDENIDTLEKEILDNYTIDNRYSFNLGLTTPTEYYVMLPKDYNTPIIKDKQEFNQNFIKLDSITDYDIYKYEFGNMDYTLYFE